MTNTALEQKICTEEFLVLVKTRNVEAFEVLVRAFTEHLYKAALGMGFSPDSSDELVQRVWATFFDVCPRFEGRSHIKTFIFGILYNKAQELRRDQIKQGNSDPIDEVMEARFSSDGHWTNPPINPENFMIASQTMDLIQKCIDNLPLNQRMAFCLKEVDDHGSPEICNILGVTVTNLGVLLYRARNRLRECIEGKAKASK